AEFKSAWLCRIKNARSLCADYVPSHREFRLRRSWNGLLPTKRLPIPTKSSLRLCSSLQLYPKTLHRDILYCGIRDECEWGRALRTSLQINPAGNLRLRAFFYSDFL